MSKFRKGDLVSIEGVVDTECHDDEVRIMIDRMWGTSGGYYVHVDKLKLVRPKFVAGDAVSWQVHGIHFGGHFLSIHGDHVWVDCGDGEFATVWVDKLTRVEPEPAPEAAPAEPQTEAAE